MPLPWQHSFCYCRKMCLAHLHPKSHICAKFHENWSKTEEVVRDARFATDRPTDRPTTHWFLYGSEFWAMYNWPFSDLEHFYYPWFAPSYSETISLGVIVKSAIRAFRSPNAKKWQKVKFLHFFHLFGTIL